MGGNALGQPMVCYCAKGLEGDAGMSTRLLTTAEVAAILRCTEQAVRAWVCSGHLKSVRPWGTKKHLFRESDVLLLVAQTTSNGANIG
jgi:excisionase family DNA binding protein